MTAFEPAKGCAKCARLVAFRKQNQAQFPDFHNAPVPSFGPLTADILIVGLAPGLKGANRTGRPFTGDGAGDLLYPTLLKFGLAEGPYGKSPDDGLKMTRARITNAVRCVPPENKIIGEERTNCRPFLADEIKAMPHLRAIVSIGLESHNQVLKALGFKPSAHPFAHGARHDLGAVVLTDSYHCSRYNTNTGRLTAAMFESVFEALL